MPWPATHKKASRGITEGVWGCLDNLSKNILSEHPFLTINDLTVQRTNFSGIYDFRNMQAIPLCIK